MPLSPNFSTSESLSNNNEVTFLDTSTGQDLALTARRISVKLANGNWLGEGGVQSSTIVYIPWGINDAGITVDLLTSSTAATVTVDWLTNSVVTYTKTQDEEWNLYDYIFAFGLVQSQTATPNIIQDVNYYTNFFQFITNIWASEAAIVYGSDIYSSQSALNRNQFMIDNSNDFF